MIHFWFWFSGAHNNSWAILWGGILSCATYFVAIPMAFRKLNCHVKGCLRLSHHDYEMDGVTYKLCRKHHPGVDETNPPTHDHFKRHHERNTNEPIQH